MAQRLESNVPLGLCNSRATLRAEHVYAACWLLVGAQTRNHTDRRRSACVYAVCTSSSSSRLNFFSAPPPMLNTDTDLFFASTKKRQVKVLTLA